MDDSQSTRLSLLVRLANGQDARAWEEFVEIYTPLVYRLARRHGLQSADAADLTQEVFRTAAQNIGRLAGSPQKGSFRGWLLAVARNRIRDLWTDRQRQVAGSGDTALNCRLAEEPARDDPDEVWDREYRQRLFEWAVAQVRHEFRDASWQAFWQTRVEGKPTREVAELLAMSEGAVYIAKSRVLARLSEKIREVDE